MAVAYGSLPFGVGGLVPFGRAGAIGKVRSFAGMNEFMFGAYGEDAAVFGIVAEPDKFGMVSSLVIVKPEGSFPDPLCFLFFAVGPEGPLGDAGRERFFGVIDEDVWDDIGGMAKGLFEVVIGKDLLKLCCKPCKSLVEKDCLNIVGAAEELGAISVPAVEKTPAPGTEGAFGRGAGMCCTGAGALCVL
jgi:hypothetical protein